MSRRTIKAERGQKTLDAIPGMLMQVRSWLVIAIHFVALAAVPAAVFASEQFDGDWTYSERDDDGALSYDAELHLSERKHAVSGTWSEGTNQKAWSGMVRGAVRDGQFHARFCYDDGWGDESAGCPHYGPESDVFMIQRGKLVWYRMEGSRLTKYVTLERGTAPRSHKVAP